MASLVKKTLRFLTGRLFLCAALILLQMGALAALVLWAAFRSTAAFTLWWAVSLALALWVAVREENGSYKAAWVLLLLGLPPAGALLWLTWGRRANEKRPSAGPRRSRNYFSSRIPARWRSCCESGPPWGCRPPICTTSPALGLWEIPRWTTAPWGRSSWR